MTEGTALEWCCELLLSWSIWWTAGVRTGGFWGVRCLYCWPFFSVRWNRLWLGLRAPSWHAAGLPLSRHAPPEAWQWRSFVGYDALRDPSVEIYQRFLWKLGFFSAVWICWTFFTRYEVYYHPLRELLWELYTFKGCFFSVCICAHYKEHICDKELLVIA